MRVLGSNGGTFGSAKYIVEISLDEIKKVADKAGRDAWKAEDERALRPGAEYDIAAGYDFRRDILAAVEAMRAGYESFARAADSMRRFVEFVDGGGVRDPADAPVGEG